MPETSQVSPARRRRVLILGGGFAGIGAAQKLKDAEADVVLVDRHDYHTFQPLLYQLATGLLETSAVGHSLRDLVQEQENTTSTRRRATAVDLEKREVRFDELEPLSYDYLVHRVRRRGQLLRHRRSLGARVPDVHAHGRVRLKNHVLRTWESADRNPSLIDDGALNIVVVGGGPTGVETAGALAELYRGVFAKDYPDIPQDKAQIVLAEAGPQLFPMFKENIRTYTEKALAKRTVEVMVGEAVAVGRADPRHAQVRTVLAAHTLVWGAGLQGNALVQSLGIDLERGNRIGVGPELHAPGSPRGLRRRRRRGDYRREDGQVLPQLGSVALQSGEHAGEDDRPAASRARSRSRSNTRTRARWRRSAAAPRSCR